MNKALGCCLKSAGKENSETLAKPQLAPYREGLRQELTALKNIISEADQLLETLPPLPENRTARCRETMRQQMKRFTRLTLGYSKKLSHLTAMVNLHFAYYNFCRTHKSIRVTPSMEAGITDHVWTIAELLNT